MDFSLHYSILLKGFLKFKKLANLFLCKAGDNWRNFVWLEPVMKEETVSMG